MIISLDVRVGPRVGLSKMAILGLASVNIVFDFV